MSGLDLPRPPSTRAVRTCERCGRGPLSDFRRPSTRVAPRSPTPCTVDLPQPTSTPVASGGDQIMLTAVVGHSEGAWIRSRRQRLCDQADSSRWRCRRASARCCGRRRCGRRPGGARWRLRIRVRSRWGCFGGPAPSTGWHGRTAIRESLNPTIFPWSPRDGVHRRVERGGDVPVSNAGCGRDRRGVDPRISGRPCRPACPGRSLELSNGDRVTGEIKGPIDRN